ncbi:MAG: pentapeptide repeat-containing protein [Myxococcota bacterium]
MKRRPSAAALHGSTFTGANRKTCSFEESNLYGADFHEVVGQTCAMQTRLSFLHVLWARNIDT